ncbi:MAG: phosphatase [Deltaproteobacteria bacterium RBG_16_71_12]|nr:MAG: phosphatase [Deltaproteobacteria bacterium RBG_16_71_12]
MAADNGVVVRRFAGHISHSEVFGQPLRVAHLTDQHVGRITPLEAQLSAVRLAAAERPDLVVITGDFVAHSQAYLDDLAEVIRGVPAPVFAVLGNHDHWCGADDVARTLTKAGAEVLRNQHTTVAVRGERLQIVGLDDAYTGHADAHRATRGLDPALPSIGLSHIAEEADLLWLLGVPLVFSGHTHAGQVTVAGLHELAIGRWGGHKYVHGLYGERRGGGAVYVGAGIGAAMFPFRLGERAKREVAIFELGAEPGSIDEHHAEQEALPGRAPSAELREKRKRAVAKKVAARSRRR